MTRRKRDWPAVLHEQRKSGESVKEFCASRGIHPNTFYKKRKLHSKQPLVEIPVTGTVEDTPIMVSVGRFSVSVLRGFDPEILKSVLEVVGDLR